MELLIAILMALGTLVSPDQYNADYISGNQAEIAKAQAIIANNQYTKNAAGIVIIDDDVSTGQ